MNYFDLSDGQFLVEGGTLSSHAIQHQFIQQFPQSEEKSTPNTTDEGYADYKYTDVLNKAFKQYSALGSLMVKKDAAITFTAIGAIGLALLCINSLIVKLVFLAVATVLSFDVELQLPCASILLAIFVFRDNCMGVSKAIVLLLSILVIIYAYWAECLSGYQDVVWWLNIFLVVLWGWLIFNGSNHQYYSRIIEFGGGSVDTIYSSITEFDTMN